MFCGPRITITWLFLQNWLSRTFPTRSSKIVVLREMEQKGRCCFGNEQAFSNLYPTNKHYIKCHWIKWWEERLRILSIEVSMHQASFPRLRSLILVSKLSFTGWAWNGLHSSMRGLCECANHRRIVLRGASQTARWVMGTE